MATETRTEAGQDGTAPVGSPRQGAGDRSGARAIEATDRLLDDGCLAVHPVQLDGDPQWSAEQRLLFAVLMDALVLASGGSPTGSMSLRVARREAQRWVRSRDVSEPFGFEAVCDYLHLDAAALRWRILAAPRQKRPYHIAGVRSRVGGAVTGGKSGKPPSAYSTHYEAVAC